MNHAVLLPILIPMFAGALLAAMPAQRLHAQRLASAVATLLLVPVAVLLLRHAAGGEIAVYAMGNWSAPFGIVLQLDRTGAMMLALTALLALAALAAAGEGTARQGRHFHALFQFQLMGLNGAFLAGDLFNLFVFFEILLIASYALLVHGAGRARVGAGLHYVILNLVASSFFLVAIGVLYGLSGTLNMAHLGLRLAGLPAADLPLAVAAGAMLMLVFALKAALFPLYFWLPRAYGSAAGPVAALFAIMTKVGIYAMLRCDALIFGGAQGLLGPFLQDWVFALALATLAVGALGALAATALRAMTSYLVVASVGLLAACVSMQSQAGWAAALYYLLSTTLCTAALFLLADALEPEAARADGAPVIASRLAGLLYLVGVVAAVGLPPLSGFLGKAMILRATPAPWMPLLWPAVLGSSLLLLIAVSRTGTRLLWRLPHEAQRIAEGAEYLDEDHPGAARLRLRPDARKLACCMLLLAGNLALTVGAAPVSDYVADAAAQLLDRAAYLRVVLPGERGAP
ncbi:Multisubunit Na+/H+ antiporter, MnhD subunit [Cupriavidus taiwanensis]|uniref:monovalent cation/H+ antiporter subunit D n=1 Tax=Cupriavidus taiwanensis TaxID=164546 RepID=UPI000E1839D7|nr:monovalent cation/H+ antiporter subunit D [Cupriavidus taiwanensis]SOY42590.1 Multisubunit Na+/H+ antiporter, MnhD subunit [Cupriavidus taiwanensis]SOZ51962.1 Multisubunit Na+/H+ antiporter, MnhD subunit [Cupriavidus taiwanensis]SOZ76952.1 Multisubunit Na+/H+ antiporter, MnhD subunit [Cupriavidus taiwanensis]SOZ77495.1 Multisubunit Na+/H+ antiporter, MnhD subunit [Cupriavidus taiwanensis]SOZ83087.1 Multisubunit Na+/H+ antiporter, MnhD subunit [Cupriavidus taiwanensis]